MPFARSIAICLLCLCTTSFADTLTRLTTVPYATVPLPEGRWQQIGGEHASLTGNKLIAPADATLITLSNGQHTLSIDVVHCNNDIGGVFKDCIDPTWERIFTQADTTQWQVIATPSARNHIIDITFNAETNQRFGIAAGANSNPNTPSGWLDLSAFKNGHLNFDIRVVDFANNINGFEFSLNCGNRCQSAAIGVYPSHQGQWQRMSIPIATLVQAGLDISQVYTGFEIQPVSGEQKNVHIQLDNIAFEAAIPAPMDWVAL